MLLCSPCPPWLLHQLKLEIPDWSFSSRQITVVESSKFPSFIRSRISKRCFVIGAVIGDVVGSCFEGDPTKEIEFELFSSRSTFTDDSVLTIAVADWLLNGGELTTYFHEYVDRYPHAGYGGTFIQWANARSTDPYNSWGNGAAMRVSPVAYFGESLQQVFEVAKASAEVTHNHPEGIKGAQAVACCIYLARQGESKREIRKQIASTFGYDLNRTIRGIRPHYFFDVSCAGSVPESIIAFLDSDSFEDAIRLAISLGGDADTMACIAGGIAEAFYQEIPHWVAKNARDRLDEKLISVMDAFYARHIQSS